MYWARRNYQRLGSPSRHLRARAARVLLLSPLRLFARIRDAYVDAMLALAGGVGRPCAALARSRSCAPEAGLLEKRVPQARLQGSTRRRGDFERRMMEHIYNMVVTPELPGAAAGAGA
ncbi:hypothetical protein E2562_029218 [Oryza meyeriana var. granulata]|uniref:Uncharacterized protein n=1 Tax=Oryza meyeriana var. granulata TaxID=110450 RepID=A0A6G1EQU1_9ORYZ|nr:hypothetical protein E2562_029218 [Oryza meyeriana var. granulata]